MIQKEVFAKRSRNYFIELIKIGVIYFGLVWLLMKGLNVLGYPQSKLNGWGDILLQVGILFTIFGPVVRIITHTTKHGKVLDKAIRNQPEYQRVGNSFMAVNPKTRDLMISVSGTLYRIPLSDWSTWQHSWKNGGQQNFIEITTKDVNLPLFKVHMPTEADVKRFQILVTQ